MKRLIRFWFEYAHRYRGWYLLGVLALLATNALMVALPSFIQHAVDALEAQKGFSGVWPWSLALILSGLAIMVVRTLSRTLFFNPGRAVEFRVKSKLFERLLELPQTFYDRYPPGDLVSRGSQDAGALRSLAGFSALQLANVLFTLLLTLTRMFQLDIKLSLIALLPILFSGGVLYLAILRMFTYYRALQAELGVLSERILESYGGARLIQAYGAEAGVQARFDQSNEKLLALSKKMLLIRAWLLPVVAIAGNLSFLSILYFGGRQMIAGQLSLGTLTAFLVFIQILVVGVTSLGWMMGVLQRGYVSLERVYEIFDAPDARSMVKAPMPEGQPLSLALRGLSFSYPGAERSVLQEISFELKEGEVLGIFGLTGSGKSSLLKLIARIYEPPEGSLFLCGQDVRDLPIDAYWEQLAYVPQSAFLFSRSIRENIAPAEAPEEIDEEALQAALRDAALSQEVESFPQGLETLVGERGLMVSGGQRQRIALARALYRPARLLLLDDVMSAVDHATEDQLIRALYRREGKMSTLVVSHRLNVLARADRIIVLEEGRISAEGDHEQLIKQPGPYAEAWKLQQLSQALESGDE